MPIVAGKGGVHIISLEALLDAIDAEWDNLEITFAEPWEISWVVPPGERDDYEMHFLEKGKGRFYIGSREYPVVKGDIILLHSMEGNSFIPEESPFRIIFTTFRLKACKNREKAELLKNLLKGDNLIKLTNYQSSQELFYRMHKEILFKSESYMVRLKLLLGSLAAAMSDQYAGGDGREDIRFTPNRNAHELINRVTIYLQDNYGSDISLADLGRFVNLHPRYLCTLFRQIRGKTVGEFLREIRLERAKRLLLYTSLSMTEIALETGFNSSQYFSRIFSQREGIDPRTFRKTKNRLTEGLRFQGDTVKQK